MIKRGYNNMVGWTPPSIHKYPNILPANVADCTNTLHNTTGFTRIQWTELITSDTEHYYPGYERSLKCQCPGNIISEGVGAINFSLEGGKSYTGIAYVHAPNGSTLELHLGTSDDVHVSSQGFTGNDDFKKVTVRLNVPSDHDAVHFYVQTVLTAQNIDFYIGKMILREGNI